MLLPLLAVLLGGCAPITGEVTDFMDGPPAPQPRSPIAEVCDDPSLTDDDFCLPTDRMITLLQHGDITILDGKRTRTGVSGAVKVLARLEHPELAPDGLVVNLKWKAAPPGGDALNNSPRKELAAYRFQELWLDEDEYLVPPTVLRCMDVVPGVELPEARLGGEQNGCVMGLLSYWLQGIHPPGAIDWARWEEDADYRRALGIVNLFMNLYNHRDSHNGNWLLTDDPDDVRVVSIDNGLALSGIKNVWVQMDWGDILLPELPADVVQRIRDLTEDDLQSLALLERWELKDGRLVLVEAETPTLPAGASFDGQVFEHGLKPKEIRKLRVKRRRLLRRIDDGVIAVVANPG